MYMRIILLFLVLIAPIHASPFKNILDAKVSFAKVVKQAMPAVVSIHALKAREHEFGHFFDDDFLKFFFGHSLKGRPRKQILEQSLGSGVIISKEGLVVTCYHVVDQADDIRIRLSDNREYKVEKLVEDPSNDLALLRVVSKKPVQLPYIEIQNQPNQEVGDLVFAIGNPFWCGAIGHHGYCFGRSQSCE